MNLELQLEKLYIQGVQDSIQFTSILSIKYREDLERLLFFNPQQKKALPGIYRSINTYGLPGIVEEKERLRVSVEGLPESQTLFALVRQGDETILAGVMVYSRVSVETIVLLHIAVLEDYSRTGKYADQMLVLRLTTQLREIAKKIKGVQSITLQYASGLMIPV